MLREGNRPRRRSELHLRTSVNSHLSSRDDVRRETQRPRAAGRRQQRKRRGNSKSIAVCISWPTRPRLRREPCRRVRLPPGRHRHLWASSSNQHRADYTAIRAAIGVREALPTEREIPPGTVHYTAESREAFLSEYPARYRAQCGIAVTIKLGVSTSCRGRGSCFHSWDGAFRRARRPLQRVLAAAAAAAGRPPPSAACAGSAGPARFRDARARGQLAVAWHLRCGDIVLSRAPAFYANILAAIAAAGVPVRHFLFWRNCSAGVLAELMPDAEVVDVDIEETFSHMAGADVLVHTGRRGAAAGGARLCRRA